MKFKNLDPFYCLAIQGSLDILVNFGTVICSSTNSANNIFVPTINSSPLKRFGESGFSENNLVTMTSANSFVCLKIYLENIADLVEEKKIQWENIVFNKNYTDFVDSFVFGMSEELQKEHFNLADGETASNINLENRSNLDIAQNCNFNRLVNFSPRVISASVVSVDIEDFATLDDVPGFNFIQISEEEADNGEYYKLVPIAIVVDGGVTQLVNFDYCFSFPFFWLDTLKEEF